MGCQRKTLHILENTFYREQFYREHISMARHLQGHKRRTLLEPLKKKAKKHSMVQHLEGHQRKTLIKPLRMLGGADDGVANNVLH
jgi:hypothetical protein